MVSIAANVDYTVILLVLSNGVATIEALQFRFIRTLINIKNINVIAIMSPLYYLSFCRIAIQQLLSYMPIHFSQPQQLMKHILCEVKTTFKVG